MFSRLIGQLPAQLRQIRLTPVLRVSAVPALRHASKKPPRSTSRNIQKLLEEKRERGIVVDVLRPMLHILIAIM